MKWVPEDTGAKTQDVKTRFPEETWTRKFEKRQDPLRGKERVGHHPCHVTTTGSREKTKPNFPSQIRRGGCGRIGASLAKEIFPSKKYIAKAAPIKKGGKG